MLKRLRIYRSLLWVMINFPKGSHATPCTKWVWSLSTATHFSAFRRQQGELKFFQISLDSDTHGRGHEKSWQCCLRRPRLGMFHLVTMPCRRCPTMLLYSGISVRTAYYNRSRKHIPQRAQRLPSLLVLLIINAAQNAFLMGSILLPQKQSAI